MDELIRKYITDLWSLKPEDTTAYLCGHPSMVENGRGTFSNAPAGPNTAMRDEVYFIPGKELRRRITRNVSVTLQPKDA